VSVYVFTYVPSPGGDIKLAIAEKLQAIHKPEEWLGYQSTRYSAIAFAFHANDFISCSPRAATRPVIMASGSG